MSREGGNVKKLWKSKVLCKKFEKLTYLVSSLSLSLSLSYLLLPATGFRKSRTFLFRFSRFILIESLSRV